MLAFGALFLASFVLHGVGGLLQSNEERMTSGLPNQSLMAFVSGVSAVEARCSVALTRRESNAFPVAPESGETRTLVSQHWVVGQAERPFRAGTIKCGSTNVASCSATLGLVSMDRPVGGTAHDYGVAA
jgi:hypothetical protein